MLKRGFENEKKDFDLLICGSCHSYTSFNPIQCYQDYGITSYNVGQGSETIAGSYLQLVDYLEKTDAKVVLVETWGINAKETYISQESIEGALMASAVDNNYFSLEKLSVILDFELLNWIDELTYLTRYKGRLLDGSIGATDFIDSYATLMEINQYNNNESEKWETKNRLANKGYKYMSETLPDDTSIVIPEVNETEYLEADKEQLNYIDKIIELCKKENVNVFFYRAPYSCTENELKRSNYLKKYIEDRGETYIDLNKEIEFDYCKEFYDEYHLNVYGAEKSTEYLVNVIKEKCAMKDHREEIGYEEWDKIELQKIPREKVIEEE